MRSSGMVLNVFRAALALTLSTSAAAMATAPVTLHSAGTARVEIAPASPLPHSPAAFSVSGFQADCGAIFVEFGDGARQQAKKESPVRWTASHAYAQPGTYSVTAAPASPCSTQPGKATVVVKAAPVRSNLAASAAGSAAPAHAPQTAAGAAGGAGFPKWPTPDPNWRGPPLTVEAIPSTPAVNGLVAITVTGSVDRNCDLLIDFGDSPPPFAVLQSGGTLSKQSFSTFHSYSKAGTYQIVVKPWWVASCTQSNEGRATVTVK